MSLLDDANALDEAVGAYDPSGDGKQTSVRELVYLAAEALSLFPVFAQARAKARQSTCVSNLRQLGVAIMAYAQDYDGTLPLASYPGPLLDPRPVATWQYLIDPFAY